MEADVFGVYDTSFGIVAQVIQFIGQSFFFSMLKVFLFVYVIVLFVDVALLFYFRGTTGDLQALLYGTTRALISKGTAVKRWEKTLDRLETGNPSQYKVAILEAEAFAEEILRGTGWAGSNIAEQLEGVSDAQLETKSQLLEAHAVRNRIVLEKDFQVSREEAEEVLAKYRAFFDEVELFS